MDLKFIIAYSMSVSDFIHIYRNQTFEMLIVTNDSNGQWNISLLKALFPPYII